MSSKPIAPRNQQVTKKTIRFDSSVWFDLETLSMASGQSKEVLIDVAVRDLLGSHRDKVRDLQARVKVYFSHQEIYDDQSEEST